MKDLTACAVMVTYQPGEDTLHNLRLLSEQVDHIVVVDNGSSDEATAMLRDASGELALTLIGNLENEGIASALNTGVKHAIASGHGWVILFDQDSTVTPGFMNAMFDGYRKHPSPDAVGIFCPQYIDRSTGVAVVTSRLAADGGPAVAMTSGSLMPAWVFERCGWFMEELFIDQVDVEYCFRVRSLGHKIARSPEARLVHSAGNPRMHGRQGMGRFRATHHGVARRYYITRNRMSVVRKNWKQHRDWCLPMLRSIVTDTLKVLLVEESKFAKLQSTFAGIRDAMQGRLGKTREI